MKSLKIFLTLLCISITFQLSASPPQCVPMVKGAKGGCGCHCQKKCVAVADTAAYFANNWYYGTNCPQLPCCWVRPGDGEDASAQSFVSAHLETSFTAIYLILFPIQQPFYFLFLNNKMFLSNFLI
jgi:hypothetical protein